MDYHETFASVAKMDSIRLVLAISASKHWEEHHMDVKSAFLHGDLHEEIYMKQHEGYITDPYLVCVVAFHTPGSCGRNLQVTRCVLGGKSRVKAVTLFLNPPFRLKF